MPTAANSAQAVQSDELKTVSVTAPPKLQDRYPRYRVATSDTLSVTFPISPELNQIVTVQPDGFITLANVGSVYVRGRTIPEVVETLRGAYAKILHDPIIAVDVTNFQPPEFTVNGEVGKPGQYPLRIDTNVLEGIAVAGGFLPTAKMRVFLFHRVSPELVEVKKLDLKQFLKGRNGNEDVQLQAGDMIFVPNKFIANFRKYVPYSLGLGSGLSFNGTTLLNQ